MVGDHGSSLEENSFELLPVDTEIENYVIYYTYTLINDGAYFI